MFIMEWLRDGVSWILVQFHALFGQFIDPSSGLAWALSIVGLVVVIRILLIPLFVKQIKSQRNLQLIQPQIKEIQKKYAGDREKQSEEMMKLYRETGTNPLASCLPLLLQMPVFFALYSVLSGIATGTCRKACSSGSSTRTCSNKRTTRRCSVRRCTAPSSMRTRRQTRRPPGSSLPS